LITPTGRWQALQAIWRLLFSGFLFSTVRWLEMLAMGLFAYRVTESAFIVALLSMLRLLPMGLFGALIGALAERFDSRWSLMLMVGTSLLTSGVLALLASMGWLSIWHLGVGCFINGICWAADNPVRRMMIGDSVGAQRIGPALSVDVGVNNVSRVLGPILAGLLLAQFDIAGVFWLGLVLHSVSLWVAWGVAPDHKQPIKHPLSLLGPMREGFALARQDDRLIGILSVTAIFNVFGWPFTSMIPVIGKDQLALGPEGVGILASMDGVGALLGAVLITLFIGPALYRRCYLGGVTLYMVMVIAFAMIPNPWLAGLALILVGIGGSGFGIMQPTLIYLATPVELRSRVLGLLSVCIGMGPIGFVGLGIAAELLGAPIATALMAACGLVALAVTHRYWKHISGG
jgi:MFS family permease